METLIALAAVLSVVSFLLKISFFPRWGKLSAALCLGLMVWLAVPGLTRLSATGLAAWTSPDRMLDGAVCVVLEAVLMVLFCFSREERRLQWLRFYPGLLVIPAVCWCWTQVLFSRPGIDFGRFAWIAALVTLALAAGGAFLLPRLVPEQTVRREGLFLINLFLLLSTIAATGAITF
jgi:hypothetical protein